MSINEDFEEFAAAMWPKLIRSAQMFGLSTHDAEEAAQVTLASCYARWRKIGRLADSPAAYAYRSLMNHCRSRGRRAREVLVSTVPDRGELDKTGETTPLLDAVQGLTRPHREVVVCRYYLDLSEEVTARVLGIPAGTVKSRAHRALAQLAKELRTGAKSEQA